MSLVSDSVPVARASDGQRNGGRIVLHENWCGPSSPGGRSDVPHWLRAPRGRSESKSVRGMRRVDLARDESSSQLADDVVLSSEGAFLHGDGGATEDMVAGGDDAIGIWREWKLRRQLRKPSRLH